ncbi:hypothetical protein LTR62_003924 [Meristemomyces frigidus]|uniref:Uncharacterized protein n=1 Tax=Meristemomyces frigidus TaxID=1508187 RepID=A0AAN7YK76_9PEZI|nr:hypothetical protein LTR62_003924 [Meristemomyces frigidus]
MVGSSPRERLSKLFHKRHASDEPKAQDVRTTPPPASPSSAASPQQGGVVKRQSSRRSIRDMVQGRGQGHSKRNSMAVDDTIPPSTSLGAQTAATKAMYPDQEHARLPSLGHQTALSDDIQQSAFSDDQRASGRGEYGQGLSDLGGQSKPLQPAPGLRSSPGRGNGLNGSAVSGAAGEALPPLNYKKRSPGENDGRLLGSPISAVDSNESRSLSHKRDVNDLRQSGDAARPGSQGAGAVYTPETSMDSERQRNKRSSLDQRLPSHPSDELTADLAGDRVLRQVSGPTSLPLRQAPREPQLADKDIDLRGVVDLTNTEDTTLHQKWAPSVTHEVIRQDVHTIFHEETTREIHEHHVFHRVLPIVDIEVLPARHFVPVSGGYAEIAEEEVPGRTGKNAQWLIAETVSKMLPKETHSIVPERFTARKFEGNEGEYKEYMTPAGYKRTEQWWVHPPTFYEPNAIASGQTYPFFLGSPDPRDDGLRARLPGGGVIGMSPLLAQQRREQTTVHEPSRQSEAVPPPVPSHRVFPADLVDSARSGPTTGMQASGHGA